MDIIDYFNKFLMSFPVANNDAINTLNSIREFFILIGYPQILQTDNGPEYKNKLFENFCEQKNINIFLVVFTIHKQMVLLR